ncbi:MAG: glycosyl hydrolase-related protein [Kiritimatiellia bacterium]
MNELAGLWIGWLRCVRVLSALRRNPRGELVLRVFNPTSDHVSADVVFGFPVSSVTQTNLAEDTVGKKVKLINGRIRLALAPKKIQTLVLGQARALDAPTCGMTACGNQ